MSNTSRTYRRCRSAAILRSCGARRNRCSGSIGNNLQDKHCMSGRRARLFLSFGSCDKPRTRNRQGSCDSFRKAQCYCSAVWWHMLDTLDKSNRVARMIRRVPLLMKVQKAQGVDRAHSCPVALASVRTFLPVTSGWEIGGRVLLTLDPLLVFGVVNEK